MRPQSVIAAFRSRRPAFLRDACAAIAHTMPKKESLNKSTATTSSLMSKQLGFHGMDFAPNFATLSLNFADDFLCEVQTCLERTVRFSISTHLLEGRPCRLPIP